jgi:hypothetical protein
MIPRDPGPRFSLLAGLKYLSMIQYRIFGLSCLVAFLTVPGRSLGHYPYTEKNYGLAIACYVSIAISEFP